MIGGIAMDPRMNYGQIAPGVMKAMTDMEAYLAATELDEELLDLIKIRVSQINGCAWCLDMHTKEAKVTELDEQKVLLVPVWRDAPVFDDKEKAALEFTEHLTRSPVGQLEVSDELYARVREHFSEKQLADLVLAIIAINGWNRLNIAFHNVVCNFVPKRK